VTRRESVSTLAQTTARSLAERIVSEREDVFVSIVRVGLAETKKFAEGYDAIFGKKKPSQARKTKAVAKKKKKPSKRR
jgi:hypothetical protein